MRHPARQPHPEGADRVRHRFEDRTGSRGAALPEYALLGSLFLGAVLGGINFLGNRSGDYLNNTGSRIGEPREFTYDLDPDLVDDPLTTTTTTTAPPTTTTTSTTVAPSTTNVTTDPGSPTTTEAPVATTAPVETTTSTTTAPPSTTTTSFVPPPTNGFD
ncbi:MAG: hypothetical protein ACK5PP_04900 [Acidimicrobiales bacterium]